MHFKMLLDKFSTKGKKTIPYKFDVFMFDVSSSKPRYHGKRSINTIENNNRAITTHQNTHIKTAT